jgi:oxepin-CoA hydrolase/3-oxo-5,6-dehydrosuberyl-CoA semialdehyde dehydrogenase
MGLYRVESFVTGDWVPPGQSAREIADAATGRPFALSGHEGVDFAEVKAFSVGRGGPALRRMGFHDRARMLKALAGYLNERKDRLYALSYHTGATLPDSKIDIDGGIGTMFVIASKGRREMPDGDVYLDGGPEMLSRSGSFIGQHICTPLRGVAVHINAFNFPVWGMLEKLAPTLLAGMPAIVKPATASGYLAEACARMILESGILPEGALQLVSGDLGDLLGRLDGQDVVSFTGSAETAARLRATPGLVENAVRFVAEQDSLNATILGPDAAPGTPEFDVFLAEVHREMTAKAGQKCTAIRRIIVPEVHLDAVATGLSTRLTETRIGAPEDSATGMGALISEAQRRDVLEKAARIGQEAERVCGDPGALDLPGALAGGAFLPPMLYLCAEPNRATLVHRTEAFGPVATVMAYSDPAHAAALANRGGGSLVASLVTRDPAVAREVVMESASHHGRIYLNNRDSAAEATGHGSPLPHMVHGGPGRAGGGEELGGVRGVLHYMQRTAIQGSPDLLSAITGTWLPGAARPEAEGHPFRRSFEDLAVGETLTTPSRLVTQEDIEHFAEFTGDQFYAHMDEDAAARNPFFPGRVAHGYLLLSFAAGLFVEPSEGPVLANTGLEALRFLKPVPAGTEVHARLTVKRKTRRTEEYGEVRWNVELLDGTGDAVAEYDLLTMVAYRAMGRA